MRNTPTGVGKTVPQYFKPVIFWKHPHGRGEDCCYGNGSRGQKETPPRAWGRRKKSPCPCIKCRNTPTGVGKTPLPPHAGGEREKHPHGRGEDNNLFSLIAFTIETPPRAWGRPPVKGSVRKPYGNTPTGVGKTDRKRLCK